MKNLFSEAQINEIFKILSAILLIGNIKFDLREMDDSAVLSKQSVDTAKKVASLLGVNELSFSNFLVFKTSDLSSSEAIQTNF